MTAYAELAITSNFSFLRGASQAVDLVGEAMRLGHAGIGIADRNTVAGVVRAYDAVRRVKEKIAEPTSMRALGFCVSVSHAQFMAGAFRMAGLNAIALSGKTPADQRKQALADLKSGTLQSIFSVDLFNEGLDIFRNATSKDLPEELRYDLDIAGITELWRRGSVVSSWLLDLTAQALVEDPTLSHYTGHVQDSGEGRWTIMAAVEEGVPADVLSSALYVRFRSRQDHTFAEKVLSAMRHKFGGHVEPPAGG